MGLPAHLEALNAPFQTAWGWSDPRRKLEEQPIGDSRRAIDPLSWKQQHDKGEKLLSFPHHKNEMERNLPYPTNLGTYKPDLGMQSARRFRTIDPFPHSR